jgi:hypothetical protein
VPEQKYVSSAGMSRALACLLSCTKVHEQAPRVCGIQRDRSLCLLKHSTMRMSPRSALDSQHCKREGSQTARGPFRYHPCRRRPKCCKNRMRTRQTASSAYSFNLPHRSRIFCAVLNSPAAPSWSPLQAPDQAKHERFFVKKLTQQCSKATVLMHS